MINIASTHGIASIVNVPQEQEFLPLEQGHFLGSKQFGMLPKVRKWSLNYLVPFILISFDLNPVSFYTDALAQPHLQLAFKKVLNIKP